MLKSLFRRVTAALGLSLMLAAPVAAKAPAAGHPALWAVADADTTIYLFGTIHLLPEKYQWRTDKFDDAIKGSNQLVVETIIDDKNPQQLMATLASMAFAKGLPPITERVSADKRAALEAAIRKSGLPRPMFDQLETWAAAFMLMGNQFKDLGLKNEEGVEMVLRSTFATQGKPVGELETNAQQLGFFDRLSEKAQRELLDGAIQPPGTWNKDFDTMLNSWARGDVAGIARSFDKDLASSPELSQSLIKQRNANWSKWIEQRMAEPGKVMIAVGAGHLAGKDSVIELLKKDGYRVERVQ